MYARVLDPPADSSFFLFGPRGVGKTVWVRERFRDALVFDLLDFGTYQRLLRSPGALGDAVPEGSRGLVVVDEVQRIPALLNEVHRLIESRGIRFVLTGSSARSLRRRGVNLLAGRALTRAMHPLTASELGEEFDLARALRFGTLPAAWTARDPGDYLASYSGTYLREEVLQEGLARDLGDFARFLEAAALSQGSVLNMAAVARDCAVSAKVAEGYFSLVEDLLLAVRIPVFTRRAKRRMVAHPKFYFFDAGVFQALRPRGPLDPIETIQGAALETLLLHHLRAANDYGRLGYSLRYWRTAAGHEVDFVLYGERGLVAIEVIRSSTVRREDLGGLLRFRQDYPEARAFLLHLGPRRGHDRGVEVIPFLDAVRGLDRLL